MASVLGIVIMVWVWIVPGSRVYLVGTYLVEKGCHQRRPPCQSFAESAGYLETLMWLLLGSKVESSARNPKNTKRNSIAVSR